MASGVDWKKVEKFAEAHWPYVLIGFVVLVGIFYTLSGSSTSSTGGTSTTTTTPTTTTVDTSGIDPTSAYLAQIQAASAADTAQAQLEAAQIAGAVQTQIANTTSAAQVAQSNASAASAAYIATTTAEANTANTAIAATSGQNIQAVNSLTQGFASYAGSLATMSAADATAAAGVVQSNDQTAGATLGATFAGAAALAGALSTGGLLGASGLTPNYRLLPTVGGGFVNLTSPPLLSLNGFAAANPGYVDTGALQTS